MPDEEGSLAREVTAYKRFASDLERYANELAVSVRAWKVTAALGFVGTVAALASNVVAWDITTEWYQRLLVVAADGLLVGFAFLVVWGVTAQQTNWQGPKKHQQKVREMRERAFEKD